MTQILRESTAVDVLIGPFVDSANGYTSEEGLSPAVELSKNGQALAAKNDATTPVVDDLGYYNCELDATDTNTVGTLVLAVEGSATALPVRHEYQVLDIVTYDAIYGASPTMLTSKDVGQLYESTIATVNSQASFDMDDAIITDDNWIGQTIIIEDVSTGDSFVTWVTDVDQANDRIITNEAPPFTVVTSDVLRVESRQHPSYALVLYDPPTRTELTTDINSILAKLLNYVQLLARKDAAIATDNATEVTAINADEGSGAGSYSNQTDALEATQDKLTAVKAKTDSLTFTVSGDVDANVQSVIDAELKEDGTGDKNIGHV